MKRYIQTIIIILSFLICSPCFASIETDINDQREINGLPRLKWELSMMCTAYSKVYDMHTNSYFSHTSPLGVEVDDIFDRVGLRYQIAGEILALGYSGQELIDAWMNSPTHRAIILDSNFKKVGCYSKNGLTACHFIK